MPRNMMKVSQQFINLPLFLAPAFAESRSLALTAAKSRPFSSSTCYQKATQSSKPKKKERNKQRGVSALRSTGPRRETRAYKFPLPEPAKNVDSASIPYELNQEHGLYQFFNKARDTMMPPSEEDAHGRAWTEKELSRKDFYDLWKLHWTCVKESNRVATRNNERKRLKVGYGEVELQERLAEVRETMANIRKVLIRRHEDFSNGRMMLENYRMLDIFPDAETALGLAQTHNPEININEVNESEIGLDNSIDSSLTSSRGVDAPPSEQSNPPARPL